MKNYEKESSGYLYFLLLRILFLVVLCVIKYIPVYNIYIGKLRAKDLIERLETYKKTARRISRNFEAYRLSKG